MIALLTITSGYQNEKSLGLSTPRPLAPTHAHAREIGVGGR